MKKLLITVAIAVLLCLLCSCGNDTATPSISTNSSPDSIIDTVSSDTEKDDATDDGSSNNGDSSDGDGTVSTDNTTDSSDNSEKDDSDDNSDNGTNDLWTGNKQ